jgi:hypothetical protein
MEPREKTHAMLPARKAVPPRVEHARCQDRPRTPWSRAVRDSGSYLAKRKNKAGRSDPTSATVGYEAQLWHMADALRGSMDAAEYKRVVLGRIFLKYISDAFEQQHARLVAADLKEAWYREAIVERWRGGGKLVPDGWPRAE